MSAAEKGNYERGHGRGHGRRSLNFSRKGIA